jgi:hypothetical protein
VLSHVPKVAVVNPPACRVVEGFEPVEGALVGGPRLAAVDDNGGGVMVSYGHLGGPWYMLGSIYLGFHLRHGAIPEPDPAVDLWLAA